MKLVVPLSILETCARDAAAFAPLETGGIFLGRREKSEVVEHMIGPGPNAVHRRGSLEVDDEWQNAQIATLYATGASVEYLGEWHSHPAASHGSMSRTDERTLLILSGFEQLRCSDPVMMIFYRESAAWNFAAWKLNQRRRSWQLFRSFVVPAQISIASL
jgi:integrative and conjugative element protein (TIGR02256 family)